MRAVIQRVASAAVTVDGATVGSIGRGLVVLVGVEDGDTSADAEALVEKVATLRVFPQGDEHYSVSLTDVAGEVLVVSQFTLPADLRKGRRPSFSRAAAPGQARGLIDLVVSGFAAHGVEVATGVFGAMMQVELVNDGPATFVLEIAAGRVR